jgi:hypothetical protein
MTTPTATPPATGTPAAGTTDQTQPECRPECKPPDCGPRRQCWPGEDDWHRAHTRIELPSERYLKAFWHTDILDVDSPNPHDRIIERRDPFLVRFRVELEGRLWRCIGGHWCFNVGFTAIGAGDDFNLSQHLPDPRVLQIPDWTGCKTLSTRSHPGSSCAAAAAARTRTATSPPAVSSGSGNTSSSKPRPAETEHPPTGSIQWLPTS